MNENEILNLGFPTIQLLQLIGIINSDNETVFKYFDLLIWLKNNIEINIADTEAVNMIQFTHRNVMDILGLLSSGKTSVFDESYNTFLSIVLSAIEQDEDKDEMKYSLILDKINSLRNEKTDLLNTMFNHGMTILRVSV